MLTPGEYNKLEEEAIKQYPELYEDQQWTPDKVGKHKHQVDFLMKVNNYSELAHLLNRFQRFRYEGYLQDLGGLTEWEIEVFQDSLRKIHNLAHKYFNGKYEIPIDQLISSIAIHRKIRAVKQGSLSILEVGPGSGLNSLVFSKDPNVIIYDQIETTQSLFLLQELINEVSYGENSSRVIHYPWWKIKDITHVYSIITANACLAEMTDKALDQYLALFDSVSTKETLFLVQCPGGQVLRTEEDVLNKLITSGWYVNRTTKVPVTTWWLSHQERTDLSVLYQDLDRKIISKQEMVKIKWI